MEIAQLRTLRVGWPVLIGLFGTLLAGCRGPGQAASGHAQGAGPAEGARTFPTVDFKEGQLLRYRFVSDRSILVDWDPNAADAGSRMQKHAERLEMVVAYTPMVVDPYGVSTIRAQVESAAVTRRGGPGARSFGADAVEMGRGESFVLSVDARGRIVEPAALEQFACKLGEMAFQADTSRGRVKDPDMIGDFLASQWFLWDPIASIERPAEGIAVGQTWESQLLVPTPMVMRKARDVTYRLDEVRLREDGPLAVIRSRYSMADSAPSDWPVPYSGRFQMSGTFGFLGPYQVLGLEGGGETLFDLERGRLKEQRQRYKLQMKASLPPMGIKADPHITIDQTLTTELVETE